MQVSSFDEFENEVEEFADNTAIPTEASLYTKLERRRKIEELMEEKKLREELIDFG